MSHLTEEQLEDILQGHAAVPEHVDQCPSCRARLQEKRALALRVRQAFSSLHADAALADRARAQITAAGQPREPAEARPRLLVLRSYRHLWPGLAIAAAIFLIVIPRSLDLAPGPRATSARTALAEIHFANLESVGKLVTDANSSRRCMCLDGEMDDGMAMPCCQRGLCLCGCQMREFQGRLVESCIIQEPNGPPVSVVVIPQSPEALGMTPGPQTTAAGRAVWQATCGVCNMASVRMGEGSCCVVGQAPSETLVSVLNALEK